jgi:ADP-heptose:LPS heptosyltransferase
MSKASAVYVGFSPMNQRTANYGEGRPKPARKVRLRKTPGEASHYPAKAATVASPRKVRLQFFQCPGDTLVATAAVECLMRQHPGRFLVAVEGTAAGPIFDHNPHVSSFEGGELVRMDNPLIHEADSRPVHFMESYCHVLTQALGVPVKLTVKRPFVYLSDQERAWLPRIEEVTGKALKYWVVCQPGAKRDYTVKAYPTEYLQAVIDHFRGRLTFVQVGEAGHNHKPLRGALNELGKTDCRQLLRMVGHPLCQGVITGESFLWHVAAAFGKPAVCLASGFLPASWVSYPTGRLLTRQGALPCCSERGCWRARVVPLGDGDSKDKSLCELPVLGLSEPVPKCMAMIRPPEVIQAVEDYYAGGLLSY